MKEAVWLQAETGGISTSKSILRRLSLHDPGLLVKALFCLPGDFSLNAANVLTADLLLNSGLRWVGGWAPEGRTPGSG